MTQKKLALSKQILLKAYKLMLCSKHMATIYDQNRTICKYVHSTSRGHEAIQLAVGMQLLPTDYASPYYRDESMLLGMGFTPQELMYQLLAKQDDYFSEGRTYYAHPSSNKKNIPIIPHQSSATGMQVIPATGMAQGIAYLLQKKLLNSDPNNLPIVVCSIGDGAMTEGEVSEALQFASLKKLPILYIVQDNEWGISVSSAEARNINAQQYATGFKIESKTINGWDFYETFLEVQACIQKVRTQRTPFLLHAKVPLLGHHTSGVRSEWYRTPQDLENEAKKDPVPQLKNFLVKNKIFTLPELEQLNDTVKSEITTAFENAVNAPDPPIQNLCLHEFAPSPVTHEQGDRHPANAPKVLMVDAALHALDEILSQYPEAIFYGQDIGRRLGGVFREAATLAEKYGDDRVFNTAIQEAYLIGSTAGMSAVGCKPIVEIQFGDYMWAGINQLVVELSKSCYLSAGKFPVQALIRIPVGAYNGGGPYHSGCIESALLTIRGIKVVFPSNAADMKGLLKAAFLDPNPVVMLEHKGLYWSKVAGTEDAKTTEPSHNYLIPLGKATITLHASTEAVKKGKSLAIITYGMGVYWAKAAERQFKGHIEIVDLRTLNPIDEALIFETVKKHGKVIVLTEEPVLNSFAESLAGRISFHCFTYLDAPVVVVGAKNLPAVPLNAQLEKAMLPNADKLAIEIQQLLSY